MDELDEAIAALNDADMKCAELDEQHRKERMKVYWERKQARNRVADLLLARGLVSFSIMRPETRGE